ATSVGDRSGRPADKHSYDAWGNLLTTTDPDGHAGTACAASQCTAYDPTFHTLVVSQTNAKDQATTTGYDSGSNYWTGFGLWPVSSTDPNGQATSYQYDPLGRVTSVILPGDSASQRTTDTVYSISCSAISVCIEVDQDQ